LLTHSQDFPTEKIWVDRSKRQRADINIDDLIPSVRARGILQPILIKSDGELIFGERRWTTAVFLKLPFVPVRFVSDLSPRELQVIELEENVKRKQLPWQDEAKAFVTIHRLYAEQAAEQGEPWSISLTGAIVGYKENWSARLAEVGEALERGDESIAKADTLSSAVTMLTRRRQRQTDSVLNSLSEGNFDIEGEPDEDEEDEDTFDTEEIEVAEARLAEGSNPVDGSAAAPIAVRRPSKPKPVEVVSPYRVEHADMMEVLPSYDGPKFNFLHLDLPYGVALNGQANQDSFEGGGYESSPDIYWNLLDSLLEHWPKFMFPSSHFFCWIAMDFHAETIARFEKALGPDGHNLDPRVIRTPLVWTKTDGKGIISDPKRRPRNVMEFCLFGSTGDRFIVKPSTNAYGCPTVKTHAIHTNEKPIPMLDHFMKQFVDDTSRVLDPTCGSGSAIRAAELLKAESAIGWEFNPEFAMRAEERLKRDRGLAKLSQDLSQ
jgi:ParB-like chromosome segregation protein Spo0J